jgi:hypothetical protein
MISHFSSFFFNIFPMEMIANLAKQTQQKKKNLTFYTDD